jgi:hypothetical protein
MHYEITLPADYDLGIIRERVRNRAAALDGFAGLGLKAYLIRERGVAGSPVNQYAPFYLWNGLDGMHRFLFGGGFRGIVDDFGRPPVRHWAGLAFEHGPAASTNPGAATRNLTPIPAGVDPATVVEPALDELASTAKAPGVHSTALAVDPRHWELVHFTLWEDDPGPDAGDRFQVLRLNTPGLTDLETGRHW